MPLPVFRLLSVFVLTLVAALSPAALAAPVRVKIEIPIIRAIQVYAMPKGDVEGEDDAYVVASIVANGEESLKRLPEEGALKVSPKKPAFTSEQPGVVWEGELADGEFAYATVALIHGDGKDEARLHEFGGKLIDAAKGVAERSKKTLSGDDAEKLMADTLKVQREVVAKVKDTFSRDKNTEHFGGLFNILVWNDGGKITKRLDPIGLTFGEHRGIDAKIYTKLKYTRPNVLDKDPSGDWNMVQFAPIDDDKPEVVRVKMLENEYVKDGDQLLKKTTDYLLDVRVVADGKPLEWELGEEQTGISTIHTYWDWAE